MSDEARLSELLLRWEKLREQGQRVSLAELCCETPDLLPRLREHVERSSSQEKCPLTLTLAGTDEADAKQPADLNPTRTFDRITPVRDPVGINEHHVPPRGPQPNVPGFEILSELGRGGMGIVLRARDLELDRDVAVKILRCPDDGFSEGTIRFVEEAHITGQLQHPGIAPVYRLGTLPDRSPFFAMKLIQGRTLAELLAKRSQPNQDWPRFLKAFEQVCQTLAYAHSRHVIHRDLKPSNIMVGEFGEVQVMDWGLAKILGEKDRQDRPRQDSETQGANLVRKPRSLAQGIIAQTSTGSILGTPAYMPQEQARGEIERLDERCDVFSLGAILCEILTGKPAYVAENSNLLLHKAAQADLADALCRLDACGADADLVSLTKRCLVAQPQSRARDAGVLAGELTAYLGSVEARLRQAELDKAKAEVKAREERRRRMLAIALGLALLVLVAAGGGGLLWYRGQQSETERIVSVAVGKAEQLRDQAAKLKMAGSFIAKPGIDSLEQAEVAVREVEAAVTVWKQAEAAVQEAESAIDAGVASASWRTRVATLRGEIDQRRQRIDKVQNQLAREQQLLRDLNTARMAKSVTSNGRLDYVGAANRFAEAFTKYGLDVQPGKEVELANRIGSESPSIRESLVVALDDWASIPIKRSPAFRNPSAVANAVDDDKWRRRLRQVDSAAELLVLYAEARQQTPAASNIVLLAKRLTSVKHDKEATELLRWASGRYPADFWIHFELGNLLFLPPDRRSEAISKERIGCYRAALALRPNAAIVHVNLGTALSDNKQLDESIAEYRRAIEIEPRFVTAHGNLGIALKDSNQLDEAIKEYRLAIEIDPKYEIAHHDLGLAYAEKKQWDAAIAEYRLVIDLAKQDEKPSQYHLEITADRKRASPHNSLGLAFAAKDQLDMAIDEYRLAIDIDPTWGEPHRNVGYVLSVKNQLDGAITEYRLAIELNPKDAKARNNLGIALNGKNQVDQAIIEYRLAIESDPKHAAAHNNLGAAFADKRQYDDAIREYRLAIEIDPKYAGAHSNLGNALVVKTQWDDAIAAYRLAIELDPTLAQALANLGWLLQKKGELPQAKESYLRASQLFPAGSPGRIKCDEMLREVSRLIALEPRLADVLSGSDRPADNSERLTFIELCRLKRRFAAAAELYAQVFTSDAKLADDLQAGHRYDAACAAALAGCEKGDGADDPIREKLRRQGVDWLRADLGLRAKMVNSGTRLDRQLVLEKLNHWQTDPDLAGIRDVKELQKLPTEEREACQKLWAEVVQMLEQAAKP